VQNFLSVQPPPLLRRTQQRRYGRFFVHRRGAIISLILGILCLSACQPASSAALPTLAVLPITMSLPTATHAAATESPCEDATCQTPTYTITSGPILTAPPTMTITQTAISTNTQAALPTITQTTPPTTTPQTIILLGPSVVTTPMLIGPLATPTLLPDAFQFGQTGSGQPLTAYRFGTGSKIILLVGGVHTGYERNTVQLVRELQDHFTRNPNAVLPQISLVLVPVLNADGLAYGEQLRGRFNANNVDLNRNWGCGWRNTAVFKDQLVDPGTAPFSEPETTALGSLIQQSHPQAVIFYHAAANGVFPGNCEGFVSEPLAAVYSAASGYPYQSDFSDYTVTGSASGWVDSQGIPSVDVELASSSETEIIQNLQAVDAVQRWLAARP